MGSPPGGPLRHPERTASRAPRAVIRAGERRSGRQLDEHASTRPALVLEIGRTVAALLRPDRDPFAGACRAVPPPETTRDVAYQAATGAPSA
jgi:hypothetical protein